MTKRLVRFATAALAMGGLLVGGLTGTASAAATCVLGAPAVSPSTLVVVEASALVTRTVTVKATNCSPASAIALHVWWSMEAGEFGDVGWPKLKATSVGNTATATGTMRVYVENALAGDMPTALWGNSKKLKVAPTLHLRRASRISDFNAAPEPVKKGQYLTITGQLQRADWNESKYADYSYPLVELQYRTTDGSYSKIKATSTLPSAYSKTELRTGRGVGAGAVVTKAKATQDGCYRLVFKGSTTTASVTTAGDCVDVK